MDDGSGLGAETCVCCPSSSWITRHCIMMLILSCSTACNHAVEQERINIIIQCLVIQEELGQQTQVSAPSPLPSSINLEETHKVISVDLISRSMPQFALGAMSLERFF